MCLPGNAKCCDGVLGPLKAGAVDRRAGQAQGREMTRLWQYEGYRRVFRTITAVWGVGFLLEAALRVVVVFSTSTGTALAISNVTPYLWAAVLSVWTIAYGVYRKKKGIHCH